MSDIRARFHLARGDFTLAADLALPACGVTALFGHSGSGKTTLLRAMAGLERVPGGYFALGETVWQDEARGIFLPTHQRALGYVFQEASLFDHLDVAANLEFGRRRAQATAPHFAPAEVADLLGIAPLLARRPASLSGGERQRVAIARALLAEPQILLMDEPLAALDLQRKQEILPYLERLHRELAIPVIYVSHAPDEVARLADHLVVLEAGQVRAAGPLAETLARTDLPAIFGDDAGVVIEARLAAHEADNLSRLEFAGGALLVGRLEQAPGSAVRCRIHAREVSLALAPPEGSSILNILPGRIVDIAGTDRPGHLLVGLRVGPTPVLARLTERSCRTLGLRPGLDVHVQVKGIAMLA